jgi:phosphohistidine phosphatase
MNRELWLLRHAKAKRDDSIEDFDRGLKKRGKLAAFRLGEWLQQQGLIPDWVLSSPARRTLSTATRVIDSMDANNLLINQDQRLYAEGLESLKAVLSECPAEVQRVLLVGHNPELEDLLTYLVGAENLPEVEKLLPTAAFARLAMPCDWTQLTEKSAQLISITDVKSLD